MKLDTIRHIDRLLREDNDEAQRLLASCAAAVRTITNNTEPDERMELVREHMEALATAHEAQDALDDWARHEWR